MMHMSKKPTLAADPFHTFLQGLNFHVTGNILRDHEALAPFLATTTLPSLVVTAFSIEMYLKCLLSIETGHVPAVHVPKNLFDLLAPKTKDRTRALWLAKVQMKANHWAVAAPGEPPPYDLDAALAEAADPFVKLRYANEGPVNLRFRLSDLPEVLRDVILEMRPDWVGARPKVDVDRQIVDGIPVTKGRTLGHPNGPSLA